MARKLTQQEIRQLNRILRPKFGAMHQVESGTYETTEGIVKYHLVIGDPVKSISQENLLRIGEILKKEWDSTAEYYYFGKRITE